jgi:hypothetical protein
MKKRDTGLYLNSTNFQRLFLVSTMTAAKFLDDFYYSNKHWAQIGGITTQEINRLELEFLFRMGFSLHMQREEYDWYAEELLSRVDCTPQPHIPDCHDKENGVQDNRQAARAAGGQVAVNVQAGAGPMLVAGRSSNPSPEDPDAFLSTHTTPKSSSSHMHEAKQQAGAPQIGMGVLPPGPAPPMPHAPGLALEMHARVAYPVHGGAVAVQPGQGIVHPVAGAAGAAVPMGYHAGGLAQAPLVYF